MAELALPALLVGVLSLALQVVALVLLIYRGHPPVLIQQHLECHPCDGWEEIPEIDGDAEDVPDDFYDDPGPGYDDPRD